MRSITRAGLVATTLGAIMACPTMVTSAAAVPTTTPTVDQTIGTHYQHVSLQNQTAGPLDMWLYPGGGSAKFLARVEAGQRTFVDNAKLSVHGTVKAYNADTTTLVGQIEHVKGPEERAWVRVTDPFTGATRQECVLFEQTGDLTAGHTRVAFHNYTKTSFFDVHMHQDLTFWSTAPRMTDRIRLSVLNFSGSDISTSVAGDEMVIPPYGSASKYVPAPTSIRELASTKTGSKTGPASIRMLLNGGPGQYLKYGKAVLQSGDGATLASGDLPTTDNVAVCGTVVDTKLYRVTRGASDKDGTQNWRLEIMGARNA